jgi:hypothetical protein
MKRIFFLLPVLLLAVVSDAQVWQWCILIKDSKENPGEAKAFLWIPENCKYLKGVVVAQNNMEESSILENPAFRKEMSELSFAEIWISPFFDHLFRFTEGAGETFIHMVNDLAVISGYQELKFAPVVPIGHSAAASWPYYFAAWKPERTLCAISVSGQWPYFRNPAFAPDIWGDRNIDFVPCLETMGEYEAANTWCNEGLRERAKHPLMPLSMLACPAEGHFAATAEKIKYIALYIKKAVQYRLPGNTPEGQVPRLKWVDPAHTGWLADKWRYNQLPVAPAAPVGKYTGDTTQAFWFFDEEMAHATMVYEARHRNQEPQLIGYIQDGKMVQQRNTHQQVNLKFEPEADGITFQLHTSFYDTVSDGSPRLPVWADMQAGSPIGHSQKGGPVTIDRITGPVIKVDDSTFRVWPQSGFEQNPHSYELWFAATHPGDEEYKPAVQQSQMIVPPQNTRGKEQHITFSPIPDQVPGQKGIRLAAVSDAGVPVNFSVMEGPAEITGNILNITGIPPRSRFPVKVSVTAWQYGSSREPQLQTAVPVTQTFWVHKK